MATYSGTAGSVVWVPAGTATVGEIKEWSATVEQNLPETTAFGDSWREYTPGIRGVTGKFSGWEDGSDAIQGSVKAAIIGGSAAITLRLYEGTAKYLSGSAFISTWEPGTSIEGVATVNFGFTGTGAWTYT
jgi:hypothetical protein